MTQILMLLHALSAITTSARFDSYKNTRNAHRLMPALQRPSWRQVSLANLNCYWIPSLVQTGVGVRAGRWGGVRLKGPNRFFGGGEKSEFANLGSAPTRQTQISNPTSTQTRTTEYEILGSGDDDYWADWSGDTDSGALKDCME